MRSRQHRDYVYVVSVALLTQSQTPNSSLLIWKCFDDATGLTYLHPEGCFHFQCSVKLSFCLTIKPKYF